MRAAWIAFVIGSSFFLFEFVARIEPSLDTGTIAGFFGLSDSGFGTLSSLFFWIYAPMQIVVGLVLDRYGARKFILGGSLCCAAGVLLFAATNVVGIAAAGRVLTGFGASFAFVSALWLVNHWFAPERFAMLSGAVNAVGMVGAAIGAVALSDLVTAAGWRLVFAVTGLVGLGIFAAAFLFLREPRSPASDADTRPVEHVRQSLATVLGNGRIWALSIVGMLYYMPVNVYAGLWGTTELVSDHHRSQIAAETIVSMVFWGMALGSIFGGWVSDLLGHRKYLVLGGAVLTGLAYTTALYLPLSAFAEGALLLAAGFFGGFQMLTFAMAKEGEANDVVGTVVAFVNMIGIAGALIFQPLVGYLADAAGGNFALALGTVPACTALAALIVLFVPEYRHPDHVSDGGTAQPA
ncbi:MFS transporter [Novosphingobium mangrovi (ex Huang et al. 2023)]|uniref:Lysosomal dipeptide transporter MFSD1 n=1 Tax=Novosphingobium mangrovi (ex Huang et al. 2023) TaxID=2976432 RepID=A0ABT2I188_9SPHN|nr:MFS transporter [Novosphingobium mangrovi (ex Huang et al. 2023)]MCT2398569.1 MFS transporter [Novosphingobium mangrovi (ex Huang et al. 2023)]